MVIGATTPPEFNTDLELIEFAKQKRFFFTFINPAGFATYDESIFKEALTDWGFFGPEEDRPDWLPKRREA